MKYMHQWRFLTAHLEVLSLSSPSPWYTLQRFRLPAIFLSSISLRWSALFLFHCSSHIVPSFKKINENKKLLQTTAPQEDTHTRDVHCSPEECTGDQMGGERQCSAAVQTHTGLHWSKMLKPPVLCKEIWAHKTIPHPMQLSHMHQSGTMHITAR